MGEIMFIVGFSCLLVSIPFLFIWRDRKYRVHLSVIYLLASLLLFIVIDQVFTCLYTDGCGNGNVAILIMPLTLLFFAFGLYSMYGLIKNLFLERRVWIILLFSSFIFLFSSLIGEYFYTISHLKQLGIYNPNVFFLRTIIEAGYFNQYLNSIHFNHFVWAIGFFGIITVSCLLKLKGKKDVHITHSIKRGK